MHQNSLFFATNIVILKLHNCYKINKSCISTAADVHNKVDAHHVNMITNRSLITSCHAFLASHVGVRLKETSLGDIVMCNCVLFTKQQIYIQTHLLLHNAYIYWLKF